VLGKNSKMGGVKYATSSKEWSKLDSLVYNFIKEKIIAYKQEVELNLELEGYGNRDVGLALKYLSKKAPFIHLNTIDIQTNSKKSIFYHSNKTKKELINPILQEKIQLIKDYEYISQQCGNWMDQEFIPRSFSNSGFIVEAFRAKNYNFTGYRGDIDVILNPQGKSDSKIFIEVKNKLSPFRNDDLNIFFSRLVNFKFKIIPIVIARRIYEFPKERLESLKGGYIELNKVLMKEDYKEFSRIYNEKIVPITRIIPKNIFPPPDIKTKLQSIMNLNEGIKFSKLPSKIISQKFEKKEYEEDFF